LKNPENFENEPQVNKSLSSKKIVSNVPAVKKTNTLNLNMEEESPENLNEFHNIKPENLYEILESRNDIDILCIKAKNAHIKYDIVKAYDICVMYITSKS
jgi:hypothetical protein